MISISDIRNASFRRSSFGGYKPYDVDLFIDTVQKSYSELLDEREVLLNEIDILNQKLDKYHEEESCIRNAILSAQKLADASLTDADNKSKDVLNEAMKNAQEIIDEAKQKSQKEKDIAQMIHFEILSFRNKLMDAYQEHIRLIEDIPTEVSNSVDFDDQNGKHEDKQVDKASEQTDLPVESSIEPEEIHESKDISPDISEENNNIIEDFKVKLSTEDIKQKRYTDLKFGANYDIKSGTIGGAYSGLFRGKK